MKKTEELAGIFFSLALTIALHATGYVPRYIAVYKDIFQLGILILFLLFAFTISRLVLSLIYYTFPPKIGPLILFAVVGVLFVGWNLSLKSMVIKYRIHLFNHPDSFISLKSSEMDLTITCDGHAKLIRTQCLIPTVDIYEIPELDFYSDGGLTKDNFKIDIGEFYDHEGTIPIPNETEKYDEKSTRLVNTILNNKKLKAGKEYQRRTTIIAPNSFTDPRSDGFIIKVNYQTESLRCLIRFDGPCSIKTETVRIEKMKDAGLALPTPEPVAGERPYKDEIKLFVYQPKVGDQYGIFWEYLEPPDTTR
jgi:hypothetical protein